MLQGFGRVGGSGTNLPGSGTGQRGIDQSLGGHLPQGQNMGTSSGQVCCSAALLLYLKALLLFYV